jgi:hypothetical protein
LSSGNTGGINGVSGGNCYMEELSKIRQEVETLKNISGMNSPQTSPSIASPTIKNKKIPTDYKFINNHH